MIMLKVMALPSLESRKYSFGKTTGGEGSFCRPLISDLLISLQRKLKIFFSAFLVCNCIRRTKCSDDELMETSNNNIVDVLQNDI